MLEIKVRDVSRAEGRVRLTLRDVETGEILRKEEGPNLVTDDGEELYVKLMAGLETAFCDYCAVGSDSTGATEGDSALGSELDRLEVTDKSITGSTVTYSTFFGAGDGNGTIWEVGMLNAPSGGVLVARYVLASSIPKSTSNTLTVDYELSVV